MELTDKNLYAYCNNNPISHIDPEGEFPFHILIGAVVGGGFVFRVNAYIWENIIHEIIEGMENRYYDCW